MICKTVKVAVFVLLTSTILIPAVFTGCDYITGEAIGIPEVTPSVTLPRWVWSAGDGPYSIVINRNTHEPIREVSPEEAFGIIGTSSYSENPVVLDVRTPEEFAGGHIREAVNIDYRSPSFRDDLAVLDKDKLYIVYCRTGIRSSAARDIMEELGFQHIINMTGGFSAWAAAGLPISM